MNFEKKIWLSHSNTLWSQLRPQSETNYSNVEPQSVIDYMYSNGECGIVLGEKEYFRAPLFVWCLQYCELCDGLVNLVL